MKRDLLKQNGQHLGHAENSPTTPRMLSQTRLSDRRLDERSPSTFPHKHLKQNVLSGC